MILQCMEKIIKEKLNNIDKKLAESIVKQATHELTQSKVSVNFEAGMLLEYCMLQMTDCKSGPKVFSANKYENFI